jgi:SecD/SecF fusion protein
MKRRALASVLFVLLSACSGSSDDGAEAATLIVARADRSLSTSEADEMEQKLGARLRHLGARGAITVERDEIRIRLTQGDDELLRVAATTRGELQFRPVLSSLAPGADITEVPVGDGEAVLAEREGGEVVAVYLVGSTALDHTIIDRASAEDGGETGWIVTLQFTDAGATAFDALAAQLVGQQLAIVIDDTVLSAPMIREPSFGGVAVISGGEGGMTENEAKALAAALTTSPLPAEIVEFRTRRG